MRHVRTLVAAVASVTAAAVAVSPAACGGGSDGGGKNGSDPAGLSGNGASASPLTKLSVPPVPVSLTSGSAKALTKGLEIPVAVFDDRGLFVTEEAGNTRRIVVYSRA
ncbi:hypothetical protein ACFXJ5_11600 [Streptomyces sp. NPDC059373]